MNPNTENDSAVTKQQWKWSALAGMASYLDAGSIVALGASLAAFQKQFGFSNGMVGTIQAIGPNAIGCAIGAFIGGFLGDKLGRKRIYQWDLLVYAAGILCIACAVNLPMLLIGTFIVGVAVGADVPTSLALVGEFAPAKARGKLLGFTQVAWCLGPSVVLWLAMAVAPLDTPETVQKTGISILGERILFFHLLVVALITWALRRGLAESARWKAAASVGKEQVKALFSPANVRAMVWTGTIYLFWNLTAGTNGAFGAYFNHVLLGGKEASETTKQVVGTGMASLSFLCTMLGTVFIFMPFSDRSFSARKWLWGIGAILQITAWGMLMFVPYTVPTVFTNTIMYGVGAALAGEAFYKVFSQEMFPTMHRGTAQGITFGVARTLLGIWSFIAPTLIDQQNPNFKALAFMLTAFLVVSGVVGFFWMPNTSGKSLEQIESERAGI
ncbi:MAG: inositol transport protein [Verrucomicrobiota bacterium]|jgi:inositol transporter-like SP family MFS transporter